MNFLISFIVTFLIEYFTLLLSRNMLYYPHKKILKSLMTKGYKLRDSKIDITLDIDYFKKYKIIKKIILFVPGINCLLANEMANIITSQSVKELKEKNLIERMTLEEITSLNNISSLDKKIEYFFNVISKREQNNKDNIDDYNENVSYLIYKELPALSYTYDEVMKLNESISAGDNVRFGYLEGRKVAILGYFKFYVKIDGVSTYRDSFKTIYPFKEIPMEEAKQYNYIVYPLLKAFNEDECLQKAYEEILNSRIQETPLGNNAPLMLNNNKTLIKQMTYNK